MVIALLSWSSLKMTFQNVPMLSLSRPLLPAVFHPFDCSPGSDSG